MLYTLYPYCMHGSSLRSIQRTATRQPDKSGDKNNMTTRQTTERDNT